MGETVEKIYYCDRGDNDNALAAAILAGNNRKDDWSTIAAMMGEDGLQRIGIARNTPSIKR